MRAKDIWWVGAGPSKESDDDPVIEGDNKAGTGGDNKADIGGQDEADIGSDNDAGTGGRDDKAGTGGQDSKGVAKPAARACYTGAQKLSRCAFLLAAHSNFFLTFSSLESIIGLLLSSGSIANSGLSVTSINNGASSSK